MNSKTTTTVRIAQIEYWLASWRGSLKKTIRDRIAKDSPIFVAKMTFGGSDRPISHSLEKPSFKAFHRLLVLSKSDLKHRDWALVKLLVELLSVRSE